MTHTRVPEQPDSGGINVGNVSGTGIAIGHGAQAIVTIYQTVLRPLPVNLSSLIRPLVEHYTAVFGGRDAELAGLDAFLADPQYPFGLLVAPAGLGKTALLVHWIARVQQQHSQWRIIFAPVSIRYQTASEQVVLGLLAHSLAEIYNDLEQFRSYDQSPSSLRALITDYLRRPLPSGTQGCPCSFLRATSSARPPGAHQRPRTCCVVETTCVPLGVAIVTNPAIPGVAGCWISQVAQKRSPAVVMSSSATG